MTLYKAFHFLLHSKGIFWFIVFCVLAPVIAGIFQQVEKFFCSRGFAFWVITAILAICVISYVTHTADFLQSVFIGVAFALGMLPVFLVIKLVERMFPSKNHPPIRKHQWYDDLQESDDRFFNWNKDEEAKFLLPKKTKKKI